MSTFFTTQGFGGDSFGYASPVFSWDGEPKYMNIRDFGKVSPSCFVTAILQLPSFAFAAEVLPDMRVGPAIYRQMHLSRQT